MDANQFGGMIPVCVGSLTTAGRQRLVGETVPEVLTWDHQTVRLHQKLGNLAFVTREQAAEMGAKAEETRKQQARIQLETRVFKLKGARAALVKPLDRTRALLKQQEAAVVESDGFLAVAEKALAEFDGHVAGPKDEEAAAPAPTPIEGRRILDGKPVEIVNGVEVPTAKQVGAAGYTPEAARAISAALAGIAATTPVPAAPAVIISEPTVAPNAATLEAKRKVEAKARLHAVIVELTPPEELGITEAYSKKKYGELQKIAAEFKLYKPGMSKTVLLEAVLRHVKTERLAELQRQEAERMLAEGLEIIGDSKPE